MLAEVAVCGSAPLVVKLGLEKAMMICVESCSTLWLLVGAALVPAAVHLPLTLLHYVPLAVLEMMHAVLPFLAVLLKYGLCL